MFVNHSTKNSLTRHMQCVCSQSMKLSPSALGRGISSMPQIPMAKKKKMLQAHRCMSGFHAVLTVTTTCGSLGGSGGVPSPLQKILGTLKSEAILRVKFMISVSDRFYQAFFHFCTPSHRRLQARAYPGIARVISNHAYSYHEDQT